MADRSSGILRVTRKGFGFLFDPEWPDNQVFVPQKLIKTQQLPEGATVTGPVKQDKRNPVLPAVESICGLEPELFHQRTPFNRLVAVDPNQRFNLGSTGELSMRVVDLIAPIGKGTRGLIVSPPKTGKTMMLEQIAAAIHQLNPQIRVIALLVDERPEEVTHFRRSTSAEVFASSNDQSPREHAALSRLMLGHIRIQLECGRDIVVLVDSLTRMARTFNLQVGGRGRYRGRSLSGGLDAGALEVPRRFFGLARNIENGGSVTIIATALVETNSRMDQVIYEEFKGTGNSELVLDRELAYAYIYPAVNIAASGTRKEHLLYSGDEIRLLTKLRRGLSGRSTKDAMNTLMRLLNKYPSNPELLEHFAY